MCPVTRDELNNVCVVEIRVGNSIKASTKIFHSTSDILEYMMRIYEDKEPLPDTVHELEAGVAAYKELYGKRTEEILALLEPGQIWPPIEDHKSIVNANTESRDSSES